jgi:hypothetical protein
LEASRESSIRGTLWKTPVFVHSALGHQKMEVPVLVLEAAFILGQEPVEVME